MKNNGSKKKKNLVTKSTFEKENEIEKIKLLVVIVNRSQGQFFKNKFIEENISSVFEVYASGTASVEIYEVLGMEDNKKDLVIGIIKEKDTAKYLKIIEDRFNVSKAAKGVAFTIKINSMIGVIIYKFLTNNKERIKNGK